MKIATAALVAVSMAFVPALAAGAAENAPVTTEAPAPSDRPSTAEAPATPLTRAQELDALFAKLKSAKDDASAGQAEDQIVALWLQSGSDTVDLLMSWSVEAISNKDYPKALDILDRIVTLKPDYAEGWNKRATVYYLTDGYSQAISDIEHVLVLEPRHFGALVGLGSIFRELGDNTRAIDAFKQALALDPHLDNARKALSELEKKTGQDI
jgi:tetratricopeptide (TPR) repeat protein